MGALDRRLSLVFLFGFALLILQGCSCTEIGCQDSISLVFEDAAGSPLTDVAGEVTIDGRSVSFSCVGEGRGDAFVCVDDSVLFSDRIGQVSTLQVNVASAGDPSLGYAGSIDTSFEEQYPNGEGCGAECSASRSAVTLEPAGS